MTFRFAPKPPDQPPDLICPHDKDAETEDGDQRRAKQDGDVPPAVEIQRGGSVDDYAICRSS
jgi:hypothetical protein